jgi:hypothetical protein
LRRMQVPDDKLSQAPKSRRVSLTAEKSAPGADRDRVNHDHRICREL